jgi:hypothetical protein
LEGDENQIDKHKDEIILQGASFVSYSVQVSGRMEHAYKLCVVEHGFQVFRVDLADAITSTVSGRKAHNSIAGLLRNEQAKKHGVVP